MSQTNVVIPTAGVEGNITSCRIENQIKSVERNSVFSLQQYETNITYDVCNKEIISEYVLPQFTVFGVLGMLGIFFLIAMVVMMKAVGDPF